VVEVDSSDLNATRTLAVTHITNEVYDRPRPRRKQSWRIASSRTRCAV
jgi:hypothetical protein